MGLSRRDLIRGAAASAPALAFLDAFPAGAAAFEPGRLIGPREAWAEVERVNREMGPTRLTGSAEHARFVAWLKAELQSALGPAGGQVFEETFENYPRWTRDPGACRSPDATFPWPRIFPTAPAASPEREAR
jgi:hypothetical protein